MLNSCERIASGRLTLVLQMIDAQGYRANVGIVLCNSSGQLLWCKRCGQDAWQFPQGGISEKETLEDALYRELQEETGLSACDVEIVARSKNWMKYRLPPHLIRKHSFPRCIGQKQRWFLLRMLGDESRIDLEHSDSPEFDGWTWVDYWQPVNEVIFFKRNVYRRALNEFAPVLNITL